MILIVTLVLDYIICNEDRIIPLKHFQSEDKSVDDPSVDQSDDQEEDTESLFNIEETNFGFENVDKDDLKIEHDGESDDDSTVEIGKLSLGPWRTTLRSSDP